MFLSSATRVAPEFSDAVPNESGLCRKPCVHKTYEIPLIQGVITHEKRPGRPLARYARADGRAEGA